MSNPMFDDQASARIARMTEELVAFLGRHDGARTSEVCTAMMYVTVSGLAAGVEDAETFDTCVERLHQSADLVAITIRKKAFKEDGTRAD